MAPGKRTIGEMVVVGVIASAIGIGVALAISWFPASASTQAGPIDTLWYVLLGVSIPIFVLVSVVVVYAVRLFKVRPGQEQADGAPIHGNTKLEVIWTTVPVMIIAALVVYAYLVLHDIEKAPAQPANELHVNVTGQQFAWSYEYPGQGGQPVKSDQLYLPANRSVRFNIVSKDVLHDFWVPQFRMKIDAVPGITTHYRVTPDKLGTYPVVCAELCGLGHAFMRSTVHVVSQRDFQGWLDQQAQGSAGAAGGTAGSGQAAAPDGKDIFVNGTSNATACGTCHTLADAGTTGTTGPNLDKAIAGAGAAAIRTDIAQPNQQIYPGYQPGIMPQDYAQTLTADQLDALVQYLVKATHK